LFADAYLFNGFRRQNLKSLFSSNVKSDEDLCFLLPSGIFLRRNELRKNQEPRIKGQDQHDIDRERSTGSEVLPISFFLNPGSCFLIPFPNIQTKKRYWWYN